MVNNISNQQEPDWLVEHGNYSISHCEVYVNCIREANNLWSQERTQRKALKAIAQEWENIEVGLTRAADHAEKNDGAAKLCISYGVEDTPGGFVALRYSPKKHLSFLKIAIEAARRLKQREKECILLNTMGAAHLRLNDAVSAIKSYEQAADIACELGIRWWEGVAYNGLGVIYSTRLSEPRRAIEYLEEALLIVRNTNDAHSEAIVLMDIGIAKYALGDLRCAIDYGNRALIILDEIADYVGVSRAVGNLWAFYQGLLKSPYLAMRFYLKEGFSAHYQDFIDDDKIGVRANFDQTDLTFLGNPYRAIAFYEEKLRNLFDVKENDEVRSNLIGNMRGMYLAILGTFYQYLLEFDLARKCYDEALSYLYQYPGEDCRSEITVLGNLGFMYFEQGDREKALKNLSRANEISIEMQLPAPPIVRRYLALLGRIPNWLFAPYSKTRRLIQSFLLRSMFKIRDNLKRGLAFQQCLWEKASRLNEKSN